MFENLFWGLMPHYHCIGNNVITGLTVASSLYIFYCYMVFRHINGEVLRSHAGNDYFRTRATFVGFRNVFLWCGINYLLITVTMFWQIYWVAAIALFIDAYWITFTVREFRKNLPDFKSAVIPKEVAEATEAELRALLAKTKLELLVCEAELSAHRDTYGNINRNDNNDTDRA